MTLRLRLAVATVAVTIPLVAALVWLDAVARHRAAAEALAGMTHRDLGRPDGQARCEADPASWRSGPRRPPPPPHGGEHPRPTRPPRPDLPAGVEPPVQFVYDEALRAASPDAPALPASLRAELEDTDTVVLPTSWWDDQVEVVVRTPWGTGPCAYVYVHGTTVPGWLGSILPSSPIWLLPVAAVIGAMLIAVGPVIGRIRRLTQAVEDSAKAGFGGAVPIEGRDEVAALARAFAAASREVQRQLAAKDQRERALRDYMANTTHDVMIPLTVLQAHLATMQEREAAGEALDRGTLSAAMNEAHYLGGLMHNLAAAAKLDAAEPALLRGPVDLNALIGRVIGRHRPIARQLDVALEHAVPEAAVVIDADVTLLEQAVSNLVYNAIRHNHAGGHVAVLLEPVGEARFRIRVLDDGPGIAASELSRLVERGFRGDQARTRAPDGQGLGLHISFEVARLHGLELRFEVAEPHGLQVDLEGPITASG